MAMLFDLDADRDHRFAGAASAGDAVAGDPVDQAFELVAGHVDGLEPLEALARIQRYQSRFSAMKIATVNRLNRDTGNDRASRRALNDGKTSQAAIDRAVKRSDAVDKNPGLIDKVADGDLSDEQLDVIADTAEKTGGAAATDAGFIDDVAGVDPDQARAVAKKFIDNHADPDGTQSRYDRMRKDRKAANYFSKKSGLQTIGIGGDAASSNNMWDAIKARADELYEADAE